jgi:hypothetical protein
MNFVFIVMFGKIILKMGIFGSISLRLKAKLLIAFVRRMNVRQNNQRFISRLDW